jgi:hypothetical protein
MGSDALSKLTKAGSAAFKSFQQKRYAPSNPSHHITCNATLPVYTDTHPHRHSKKNNEPDLAEAVHKKNFHLRQIAAKISGNSESEVPRLICMPGALQRAVFLVTTPIAFGKVEVSRKTYELLARHVGMSLNSVSHWAVVVVDRGLGPTWT